MNQFPQVKAVVFDLDGTVYQGDHLVPGILEAMAALRGQGLAIYFCTNNSSLTRPALAQKLTALGIETAVSSVFSAGYGAASYLKGAGIERVSLLGTRGLRDELGAAGLEVSEDLDRGQALVVGIDPQISYARMTAFAPLRGRDFPIVACNRDRWFPGGDGKLQPGCGIMVDLVEALLGRGIDLVAGKPNTLLLEMLALQTGLGRDELLVVGDSPESDVALAQAFGSSWVLYDPCGSHRRQGNRISSMTELPRLFHS